MPTVLLQHHHEGCLAIHLCSDIYAVPWQEAPLGARGMTWWAKCLLHRHRVLSSDPQRPSKMPGVAAHSCNPSAGRFPVLIGLPV